jgi:hypothetical protein
METDPIGVESMTGKTIVFGIACPASGHRASEARARDVLPPVPTAVPT